MRIALIASIPLLFLFMGNPCFPGDVPPLPNDIEIEVSGHPVPAFLLKALAFEAVSRELRENGLTTATVLLNKISSPPDLLQGETVFISVPIRTSNPKKGSEKILKVAAKNTGLKVKDDDYLMISNDPEVIPKEGILFQGELKHGESARLLYYHAVPPGASYDLITSIENPTGSTIEIFASIGLGGPSNDGIYAGHVATYRYMKRMKYNAGKVIRIPPGKTYELISQRLLPSTNTGTGIAKIWLMSGSTAKIELKAKAPGSISSKLPVLDCTYNNGRISSLIYFTATTIEKNVNSGDKRCEIRIGEEPSFFSIFKSSDIHLGNYGLLHKIRLKLKNEKGEEKGFSIRYSARGGPSRGIFLIDGEIYQTGLLGAKKDDFEEIMSVSLPPKTFREFEILLMPQPGSFYPTILSIIAN